MRNWAWVGVILGSWGAAVGCSSTDSTGTCRGQCQRVSNDGGDVGGAFGGGSGGAANGGKGGATNDGCVAGEQRGCVGPGLCAGTQTCSGNPPRYDACRCGVTSSGGSGGLGAGGAFGGGGFIGTGNSPNGGAGGIAACAGTSMSGGSLPMDLYVMFDQSTSMYDQVPGANQTWWQAAVAGATAFVNAPASAGAGVGIQYFPLGGVSPASCNASYATPEVEIGLLPGSGAAIVASLSSHSPSGFTPTAPALTGAINHMKAWGPAHPGRTPAVVLVTDGFPTECEPNQITDLAVIAKAGFETSPSVRTFVITMNMDASSWSMVGNAGGGVAKGVQTGDIAAGLKDALLSVLAAGAPGASCDITIPPMPTGQVFDENLVTVRLGTDATHPVEETLPRLSNLWECAATSGWYYDSSAAPTKILLCPSSCSALGSRALDVRYGCASP